MSKRVKTYDELDKIEREAYASAVRGDLFFIRWCKPCIDGYFLVVSRDDVYSMGEGTYYILDEDIRAWPIEDKKAFKWKYGVHVLGLPDEE